MKYTYSHTIKRGIIGGFAIAGSLFSVWLASQTQVSPEWLRQGITQKLEEFARLQEATRTVQTLDLQDSSGTVFDIGEAAVKVQWLSQDVDTVVSDIEKIQEARKEDAHRYEIVLNQVKRVIIDIKLTKQHVTDSVTKIDNYSQRMIKTLARMKQTEIYINNTQETLLKLLPALYILQNDYKNQAGDVDDLKLLLGDENIGETLSYDDMLQWLSVRMDTLLESLSNAQTQYAQAFKDLHETRKQLKAQTLVYRDTIRTLEEQKAYLMNFLELYKNNKIKLDTTLENLFETRAQLNNRITLFLKDLYADGWMTLSRHPSYIELLKQTDEREQRANPLGWPTLPISSFRTLFNSELTVGDQTETYSGIIVDSDQWAPLYAPADGFVYQIQSQSWITTNWMMLVHKNWYVTVFTSIMEATVQKNEMVKRWQIIGRVGGQPGTQWAGWFSYAPGVQMRVYKMGVAVDPLTILDLSVLKSKETLPSTYHSKYDIDMRSRNITIDFSSVVYMDAPTPRERRLQFLQKVGAAPYNSIELWEAAAEGTNVDVDLGICIGYAETSLGRNFASANNIGNVGNNDRGDRVDKDSPIAGARAIYQTLNNQYLGGYHTLYELSGYGNKDGAIYASSEYNWQKNISKCLSSIKGYIVPEDFPFRTLDKN